MSLTSSGALSQSSGVITAGTLTASAQNGIDLGDANAVASLGVMSNSGAGGIAFVNGASFAPGVLSGLSQSQIAGNLSTPASPLTQAVVSAANQITATICAVDGDKPDAVCESKGVLAADDTLKITPPH